MRRSPPWTNESGCEVVERKIYLTPAGIQSTQTIHKVSDVSPTIAETLLRGGHLPPLHGTGVPIVVLKPNAPLHLAFLPQAFRPRPVPNTTGGTSRVGVRTSGAALNVFVRPSVFHFPEETMTPKSQTPQVNLDRTRTLSRGRPDKSGL